MKAWWYSFLFLGLIVLPSCAHQAGLQKKNGAASGQAQVITPDELKHFHENCGKGNPFACADLGDWYEDNKDYVASFDYYMKGCDLSLGSACSQASIILKMNLHPEDSDGAKPLGLALRSCDLNDTLGCYNAACYFCIFKKDIPKTLEFLKKAVQTGYRDLKSLEEDPDLQCIRGTPEWQKLLSSIPPEAHPAHRAGRNFLFSKGLGASFLPVPGFSLEGSPGFIEMHDEAGSQLIFYGVNVPFHKFLGQFKAHLELMKGASSGFQIVEETEGTMNEYPTYFNRVKVTQGGMEFILMNYFIGTDDYTVQATSHYLSSYQDTYGEWVRHALMSPVLSPWQLPGENMVPYTQNFKTTGLKFAGSYLDQFHYNTTGSFKESAGIPHLIFTPVKFAEENDRFSTATALKVFNSALEPGFGTSVNLGQVQHERLKNRAEMYSIQVEGKSKEAEKKISVQMFLIDFHEKIQDSDLGVSGILLTELGARKDRALIMSRVKAMQIKKQIVEDLKSHPEKIEKKKEPIKSPVGTGDTSVG